MFYFIFQLKSITSKYISASTIPNINYFPRYQVLQVQILQYLTFFFHMYHNKLEYLVNNNIIYETNKIKGI